MFNPSINRREPNIINNPLTQPSVLPDFLTKSQVIVASITATTGTTEADICWTHGMSLNCCNNWSKKIIANAVGATVANKATRQPTMPVIRYPIYPPILVAIGPGMALAMANVLANSSSVNHLYFLTASRWTSGIDEGPPPKPNIPTRKKAAIMSQLLLQNGRGVGVGDDFPFAASFTMRLWLHPHEIRFHPVILPFQGGTK